MKKNSISELELLTLIHNNLDIDRLKEQNNAISKAKIDKLFHNLSNHLKEDNSSSTESVIKVDVAQEKKYNTLIVNIDGASKGNPGKAGIGAAIFDKDLRLVKGIHEYIGITTNNVAEYRALIFGIKEAIKYGPQETLFKTDSELLAKQILGEYRVKSPHLKPLYSEVKSLLRKLPKWKIKHIPREENSQADLLANQGVEMAQNS